jgi:uncharacterized protein (DUF362 family)
MQIDRTSNGPSRRGFIQTLGTGIGLGALGMGCAGARRTGTNAMGGGFTLARRTAPRTSSGPVSFVASKDSREAAYQALKPLQQEIERAIGDKQVIIKTNSGQVREDWWLNATDPDFTAGILQFLGDFYDRPVIVAESTAAGAMSTLVGYENYGFMPLEREFGCLFRDLNDESTSRVMIKDDKNHPLPINIINTYLDPDIYLISATRLKSHNCVVATLSMKNVAMGSPINHYKRTERKNRNEKPLMHSGGNRGLSYNMFRLATLGVQPDLAVLDGVVGMEGNGPVSGTPVEQGVALASTDWLAADRIGVELMGMNYAECKYLHWCKDAGFGEDDTAKIKVIGPDWRSHVVSYQLHPNIEGQREWLREDYPEIYS